MAGFNRAKVGRIVILEYYYSVHRFLGVILNNKS